MRRRGLGMMIFGISGFCWGKALRGGGSLGAWREVVQHGLRYRMNPSERTQEMEDRPRYSLATCKSGLGSDFLPRCATLNRYATAQQVFCWSIGFSRTETQVSSRATGSQNGNSDLKISSKTLVEGSQFVVPRCTRLHHAGKTTPG
jgi:hypothetical protein